MVGRNGLICCDGIRVVELGILVGIVEESALEPVVLDFREISVEYTSEERFLPATRRFSTRAGTRHLYGMS